MKKEKLGSVFYISLAIIILFVIWGIISPEHMANTTQHLLTFIIETFGWFYLFATFTFVVFVVFLGFGPYNNIKLGQKDDEPEYSFFTWLGMLFSAGMGIGLVFWGVAETTYRRQKEQLQRLLMQLELLCVILFFIGEYILGLFTL